MHTVLDVNAAHWEREILRPQGLVVVDFWHEHCPWCKILDPIYSEVSEEYENKLKFAKLNVLQSMENRAIAITYGVMGTPTLVFFCSGKIVQAVAGLQPKERLRRLLDDVIGKYRECVEKSTELKP